jgi:hypothetical protein
MRARLKETINASKIGRLEFGKGHLVVNTDMEQERRKKTA